MSRKLFYGGGCKNFPGTETIPFQWSDHIMLEDRSIDDREYFCMEDKDPKSEFAETVIENLGETGTIFTYIGYEAGVLKHLADQPIITDWVFRIPRLGDRKPKMKIRDRMVEFNQEAGFDGAVLFTVSLPAWFEVLLQPDGLDPNTVVLTVLTVVALGIVDDANAILLRLLKERKTAGSYRTTITGQGA